MIRTLFLITFMSSTALAQSVKPTLPPDLGEKHEDLFGTMDHLAVDFNQTVYRKLRNKTFERSGQAFFSKPSRFLWSFDDKAQGSEKYFFNGQTLAHFQKKDNTVTYYTTKTNLVSDLQDIVDIVLDSRKLLSRYEVSGIVNEKGSSSFRLRPKTPGELQEIAVKVSEELKYVKEVHIQYTDGNYSTFRFQHPNTKPISAKIYEFTNPGNVKVKRLG